MIVELVKIYFEAGADVVTIAEDDANCDRLSSNYFENMVKPYLKDVFKESGAQVLSMIGSAGPIMKYCVETGARVIMIEEKIAGNTPIGLLRAGPVEAIEEHVKRIIDKIDIVSPGGEIPLQTPSENIKAMVEATKEFGNIHK